MNSEIRPARQLDINFLPLDSGIENITPANINRRPQRWQFKLLRFFWQNTSDRRFSVGVKALKSEP